MERQQTPITRQHRRSKAGRKETGKGERLFLAGRRFHLPKGLESSEVELRKARIRTLWSDNQRFCLAVGRPIEWTEIAIWTAEHIRFGEQRVPYPTLDDILASYDPDGTLDPRLQAIIHPYLDDNALDAIPVGVDEAHWREAEAIYEVLTDSFPSVSWLLPQRQVEKITAVHERKARRSLDRIARICGENPIDSKACLVAGTFHEAVEAYLKKRRADFTKGDEFDGSGHHMLGLANDFITRQPNVMLAELGDFTRIQQIYDFWRNRPINLRTKKPLSYKHCSSHIGELNRFFRWLHTTSEFSWRKPEDFDLIEKTVKRLQSDRQSIHKLQITTFSLDELRLLYKHAIPSERLKLVWCLNCAHGAAELGRAEWEDLFLMQPHPWVKEGLRLDTGAEDSWCGLLRPKTDVLGWWWLWPETVQLVCWWKTELGRRLDRSLENTERIMLTNKGTSLYRDASRNAQTGFANEWKRLFERINKAEEHAALPWRAFGTLRNQFSNWLGGDEAKPVIASVALAHGIPHKGDKLLYKHYSNKPWKHLFESQREYRAYLQPVFDETPSVLTIHDPLLARITGLWIHGERKAALIADACGVSSSTVYRRLQESGLNTDETT